MSKRDTERRLTQEEKDHYSREAAIAMAEAVARVNLEMATPPPLMLTLGGGDDRLPFSKQF
jgi:hypothetical protein